MSTTALIIVLLGLSIMISRAPLIVAPTKTRDTYLKLFDTDGKMRVMGLIMGAVSALIIWAVWGLGDIASLAVTYVAGFVLFLSLVAMIPFPAFSSRLAINVWMAFPPMAMRFMGALAVGVGGLLVWYGLNL
jgi:hypothetical protein